MTEAELFRIALDSRLMDLHTAMPGRVEKYDASKQVVDVLPQLKRAVSDGEGDYVIEDLPVIPNVPVCFPRAGGFFVSFPIQKGDMVLIVFAERAIGAWKKKGEACDPGDRRMHPLAGAMAIPGVYPSGSELGDADGSNMVMGKDGTAAAQVVITPSMVKLGGGDQFVALANKVNQELTNIQSTFNAFVPGSGGASFPTPYVAGTVDAQNVKAT